MPAGGNRARLQAPIRAVDPQANRPRTQRQAEGTVGRLPRACCPRARPAPDALPRQRIDRCNQLRMLCGIHPAEACNGLQRPWWPRGSPPHRRAHTLVTASNSRPKVCARAICRGRPGLAWAARSNKARSMGSGASGSLAARRSRATRSFPICNLAAASARHCSAPHCRCTTDIYCAWRSGLVRAKHGGSSSARWLRRDAAHATATGATMTMNTVRTRETLPAASPCRARCRRARLAAVPRKSVSSTTRVLRKMPAVAKHHEPASLLLQSRRPRLDGAQAAADLADLASYAGRGDDCVPCTAQNQRAGIEQ